MSSPTRVTPLRSIVRISVPSADHFMSVTAFETVGSPPVSTSCGVSKHVRRHYPVSSLSVCREMLPAATARGNGMQAVAVSGG